VFREREGLLAAVDVV
jgi:hypothetical protein